MMLVLSVCTLVALASRGIVADIVAVQMSRHINSFLRVVISSPSEFLSLFMSALQEVFSEIGSHKHDMWLLGISSFHWDASKAFLPRFDIPEVWRVARRTYAHLIGSDPAYFA